MVPLFRGRPRWVGLALGAILVIAALLYTWNISYSGLSAYYASSARSMSGSLHAFLFGAMDPAATTTLDKLSGFLVPQALSIRLFGFHAWALTLPQAIEGVITVFAGYVVGTRWRGHRIGLSTAAVLAVTPMLAAMFGKPMEDGMLTMSMALAFVAWQHAALVGRGRWLLVAGLWVAIGFQAKMLQAWLILPALGIGYFFAVGGSTRRRLATVGLAGIVAVVLSLSWIGAMQLVPAQDRPFFDGSTNNNAFSMVFGYNGIDRIIPGVVSGSVPQLQAAGPRVTATSLAGHSIAKLVLPQFSTQIGWLYPAVIAGAVFGLVALIRRREDRAQGATTLALVLWLAVTAAVLSVAFVPHATYFAVIAMPLALLATAGAAAAIARFRTRQPRALIPLVGLVAAQVAWGAVIIAGGPTVLQWTSIPLLVLGVGSFIGLLIAVVRPRVRGIVRVALVAAIASAMLGPVAWSACVIGPGGGGSASDAYAGPRPPGLHVSVAKASASGLRRPFAPRPDSQLSESQKRLLAYIEPRNSGRDWLFMTDTLSVAESFILYGPYPVVPMAGFSQQAPQPTVRQVRADVRESKVRFVLITASGVHKPNPVLSSVREWVTANCSATISGAFEDNFSSHQVLYDCSKAAVAAP